MATLFVSPFGEDGNPGTLAAPFPTVQAGIDALHDPGDTLFLRAGNYAENIEVIGKTGSAAAPIRIRAYGRERVTIDGAEPVDVADRPARFRVGGNDEWRLASELDADAHPEEYVSVHRFPTGSDAKLVRHGAFLDREPYTRLITYSRLQDLRAVNQAFGRLDLDDHLLPLPGLPVLNDNGDPALVQPEGEPARSFKRPWVYMGPGLFLDAAGRIHIRLSHTANDVTGIADYDGGTDPRQLRLALSRRTPAPLVVENCGFLQIDHLELRFGGDRTIRIEKSHDVVLDHVRILAGSEGVRLGENSSRVVLRHCEVLGGIPTWMFRSDIKDVYRCRDGATVITNDLGHGTSSTLLSGAPTVTDAIVHHCEFVDGHDMAMFGQRTSFHHNWIDNVHDDALIVDIAGTSDLEVSQNVVMRCLEALSFAREEPENLGGARAVHHNLIDLRGPTRGIRPRPPNHLIDPDDSNQDGSVFRFGQLYKRNPPDGALDLFHNTCLVAHQTGQAGIQHYVGTDDPEDGARRAFNNVFIDVDPGAGRPPAYVTAFVPEPDFHGPTDGNCYFQLAGDANPRIRHRKYALGGVLHAAGSFDTLADYRGSDHFTDSKAQYGPGFEAIGIDDDPLFERIAPDGVPQFDDDLRMSAGSPAREQGVDLADPAIGIVDPLATGPGSPDLGCHPFGGPGLAVGVDGRRQFPEAVD